MPDWDANSPALEANLRVVLLDVRTQAVARVDPALALARNWHATIMRGLTVPTSAMIAKFRGEAGLEHYNVIVGQHSGVKAGLVRKSLQSFEIELQKRVSQLDRAIAPGSFPTAPQLAEVLALCAWAHAEWVRIHPFANGNGRIARLWANFLARRYGLPFFVRLRPRPNLGYSAAGDAAMRGDWRPTEIAFRRMLAEFLAEEK